MYNQLMYGGIFMATARQVFLELLYDGKNVTEELSEDTL